MGCNSSKTKGNQNAGVPEDAAAFMKLVNTDGHPVARRVLEEWSILVDAKQRSISQGSNDPMTELQNRPNELWATANAEEGVTHESVDEVGKSFLKYLKNDLLLRKWAGTFDYAVAGVVDRGYLRVTARLHMQEGEPEHVWEVRVHYHHSAATD